MRGAARGGQGTGALGSTTWARLARGAALWAALAWTGGAWAAAPAGSPHPSPPPRPASGAPETPGEAVGGEDEGDDVIVIDEGDGDTSERGAGEGAPGAERAGDDDVIILDLDDDDGEGEGEDQRRSGVGGAVSTGGVSRVAFTGRYASRAAVDLRWDGGGEDVLDWRNRLTLRTEYEPTTSLRVVLDARFTHKLLVEGRREPGDTRPQTRRGIFEPELGEAYVLWRSSFGLDVAVGNQVFSWGRTDFTAPLSTLNPMDLRDGPLDASSSPLLPVWALELSQRLGGVTLSAVWIPWFQPHRVDLFGSDWAAMRPGLDLPIPEPFRLMLDAIDPTRYEELQGALMTTRDPPQDGVTGADAAARLTTTVGSVDLGLSYAYQWDRTPVFVYDNDAFIPALLGVIGGDEASVSTLRRSFSSTYQRRHVVGMDFATTWGPVGIKGDAAFSHRRTFYTSDTRGMVPIRRPSLLWALELDYLLGEVFALSVEVSHLAVFDLPRGTELAVLDPQTVTVSWLAQLTLFDQLELSVLGIWGATAGDLMLKPRARWRLSPLAAVEVGLALFVAGPDPQSFASLYDSNDFVYLDTSLTF